MSLEKDRKDRSYQYGRLLAVLEKAEKDTYGSGESRETNAIRSISMFIQKPLHTTSMLIEQLKRSYFSKLTPAARAYYDKLIGEILENISEMEENNASLKETYVLGYYLQKNSLYTKNNTTPIDEEE